MRGQNRDRLDQFVDDKIQNKQLCETVRMRLREYRNSALVAVEGPAEFDPQLSFLASFIKKDLDKGGKLYDESKKLTNFDVNMKKAKEPELKTKYTKEFIEKNMKKDYDGLGEVRFKGKSKWGEDGFDQEGQDDEGKGEAKREKGLKRLSKKKQQRLEEKSKKLLNMKKKKKKKKKQKNAEGLEGFGDQQDLFELAGKGGGWGGEGFTERAPATEDQSKSNTKAELSLPKAKSKKKKKSKKKEKKAKKKKKQSKSKQKAQALFGAEQNETANEAKQTESQNQDNQDDKFSDLDLILVENKPKQEKTLLKPLRIDIEDYQEKWEELEDKQEEFKLDFTGSISKLKRKLQTLGFSILDVQDSEIICAGLYNSREVLLYIGYDSDESDGIIASEDANVASLVISGLS